MRKLVGLLIGEAIVIGFFSLLAFSPFVKFFRAESVSYEKNITLANFADSQLALAQAFLQTDRMSLEDSTPLAHKDRLKESGKDQF